MHVDFICLNADASDELVEAVAVALTVIAEFLSAKEERLDRWCLLLDGLQSHLHWSGLHLLRLVGLHRNVGILSEEDVLIKVFSLPNISASFFDLRIAFIWIIRPLNQLRKREWADDWL